MHLKGLLEVEMLEPLLLGARACPDDKEMAEVVERAINVFMLAYGPRPQGCAEFAALFSANIIALISHRVRRVRTSP